MNRITQNITDLKQQLQEAVTHSEVASAVPTLIAVSKMQPIERIKAALDGGQRVFGENRVQEAQRKWPALKNAYDHVILHLIGPLQSNKASDAVALFDVIHTIDRPKIADAVAHACREQHKSPLCFIQVNTGEEAQKAGIAPKELPDFLAYCQASATLPIAGLMCIPPVDENPALHFALLYKLAQRHGLKELSMGMSGDYLVAAKLGASFVRVGTAIFGERESH